MLSGLRRWQPKPKFASSLQGQAKAMVLERNLVHYAATALGQIYSSMEGAKITDFTLDSSPEDSPSSALCAVLQEFQEDLLAHKASVVRCHKSTLQAADMQAWKDAEAYSSTQEQLRAKQAGHDRLKRRHTGTVRYLHKKVSSTEAQHAAEMEKVVLVEAQRRAERDQAQVTAAGLSAELETALRDKDAVMQQAEAARAKVQAGKREQQKLKNLLENVLRTSVPSHRLAEAEEARDAANKLATAAQKQLATAKAEATTAKATAAKEADAATILRQDVLQLNRRLCVPGQKKEKESAAQAHPLAKESQLAAPAVVQGKAAAAADQHGLPAPPSVPQPVAKALPGSGPVPDSEGSIKAVLAGKLQQPKQSKAAAADQGVSSMADFVVAKAAPQPTPKSDLEAGIMAAIAQKAKQLNQIDDKDGVDRERAYVSIISEIAELEGQAAHVYYMHKGQIMPEGKCPETLLEDTATLVSCDYDIQARKKYTAASRKEQAGSWKWVASPFSRAVRTLAPSQAVAAHLGKGGRSLGFVNYAEVLLANGHMVPCALKKLPYSECILERLRANSELAALRDAEGCPHLAQCCGAFEGWCPEEKRHCLWLVMKYAEGLSFEAAYRQQLLERQSGHPNMHYSSSKLLMQHVLKGLQWLHERGRAMCDLKPDNLRIQMGQQPGTFSHVTLIDLGGSVKYKGPMVWAPITMGHNLQHLCPEYARYNPLEVLDCCALDMWGAGCLMQRAFTGTAPWRFPTVGCHMTNCATLSKHHEAWAKALTTPNAVATGAHPLLSDLEWAVPSRAYPQAAALLVQLLQPDMHTRATAQQALASQFLTGDR